MLNSADEGSSEPVRTIENPDVRRSPLLGIWDGTDEDGQQVPDGCYQYRFHKSRTNFSVQQRDRCSRHNAPDLAVFFRKPATKLRQV